MNVITELTVWFMFYQEDGFIVFGLEFTISFTAEPIATSGFYQIHVFTILQGLDCNAYASRLLSIALCVCVCVCVMFCFFLFMIHLATLLTLNPSSFFFSSFKFPVSNRQSFFFCTCTCRFTPLCHLYFSV